MKSTLQINPESFRDDAKKMVVITSTEQALILQSVESLKQQAEVLHSMLRSMGFDHYSHITDNPRTVARLNLSVKGQETD